MACPRRLLTANFLHDSFVHLASSCYALATVAPAIEEVRRGSSCSTPDSVACTMSSGCLNLLALRLRLLTLPELHLACWRWIG